MPAANVRPYQIVAGVADVYVAPTGSVFPPVEQDPSVFTSGTNVWKALGHTDGGITVRHTQTVVDLRTDQVTAPVKAVRSEESLELVFSLAEVTAENYARVLNQAVAGPTSSGGHKKVNLYRGGFGVETVSMLIRGEHLSPEGDFNLQYEIPHVYQSESPEVSYVKDEKALLSTNWMAIAANAFSGTEDDANIFGILRIDTA